MRDINRIDNFCEDFKELWKKYPDLRFGQLILNVIRNDTALYYMEDEELLNYLRSYYEGIM